MPRLINFIRAGLIPALGSHLSRQIASGLFVVVFGLQLLLLIPAYENQRNTLIAAAEREVLASLRTAIETSSDGSLESVEGVIRDSISSIHETTSLRGGVFYSVNGDQLSRFGEPLYYQLEELAEAPGDVPGHRMEIYWDPNALGSDFGLAARIDCSDMPAHLSTFLWAAIGIMFLSSILVSAGALLVVNQIAVVPLLELRSSLLAAGSDPANASEFAPPNRRRGVLGDLSRIIKHLLQRVSQTFREELATFAAMVEQSGEGIIAYDADGRLVYANSACLKFCGAKSLHQLKQDAEPLFREEGGDEDKTLNQLLKRDSFAGEVDLVVGDNPPLRCLITAKRIKTDDGRILRSFGSLSDISQIRKAQWEVEQKNVELEEANRIKAEFLAQMSHELRTPLNAIIGFSEILSNRPEDEDQDGQVKTFAGDINSSGHHLLGLINDILDLSKLEAGKQELAETDVDLVELAHSALAMLRETAGRNEIMLETHLPEEGVVVSCDAIRIKQVLLNLLSNAVKFTDRQGTVTMGIETRDDAVNVYVRDTGIGMKAEDIPKALQPFAQVDSGYNRKYDGTGLGLPICSGLVELHGGKMHIESERGHGTLVSFTLPLSRLVSKAA